MLTIFFFFFLWKVFKGIFTNPILTKLENSQKFTFLQMKKKKRMSSFLGFRETYIYIYTTEIQFCIKMIIIQIGHVYIVYVENTIIFCPQLYRIMFSSHYFVHFVLRGWKIMKSLFQQTKSPDGPRKRVAIFRKTYRSHQSSPSLNVFSKVKYS